MSQVFTFRGALINPIVVYNNATIYATNDSTFKQGDIVCRNTGTTPQTCYNFLLGDSPNDGLIQWFSGSEFLSGLTVNGIYNSDLFFNTGFEITQNYTFTQKAGQQSGCCGRIFYYVIRNDQTQLSQQEYRIDGNSSGTLGTGSTNYTNTLPFRYSTTNNQNSSISLNTPGGVQARSSNNFGVTTPGPQQVRQASMELTMDVTLTITCDTSSILGGICFNICNTPDNLKNGICTDQYTQSCLDSVGADGQAFIFSNQPCQSYFASFLTGSGPGPNGDLDAKFTSICAARFPGDTLELYRNPSTPQIDRSICACHLSDTIYTNLQNSLTRDFPGSQFAAEIKQCLFPDCPSSPYKSLPEGKKCPVPKCFQLTSVNNNGEVGGNISIEQDCEDLTQKGSAHSPGDGGNTGNGGNGGSTVDKTKSWIEKHWVWLAIGISLLVILIIIVIILASSGKKKKAPIDNFENI